MKTLHKVNFYFLLIQVTDIDPSWEEAQFNCANYYYKWSKAVNPGVKQTMMPHVIKHYGESLKYGSNNIFQSLPRLLTTWFDLEGLNLLQEKEKLFVIKFLGNVAAV